MKFSMKAAATIAAIAGFFTVTACAEMLAVTEGLMTACQSNLEACDEALFTGNGPPPPLDPARQ
jgi:hypothetical protein